MAKEPSKVRPLMVRSGARYECFGTGLCCSDIHGIGPLTESEVVSIRRIDKEGPHWSEHHEDHMMRTAPDGCCIFLRPDRLCSIHAEHGADAKPEGCRRFPLGLVATPQGGRVTTDHRCPCRTLGERPELSVEAAEPSVCDSKGRPKPDRRVNRVRIAPKKKVTFDKWLEIENDVLDKLRTSKDPSAVLGKEPFPELKGTTWQEQADEFLEGKDGTQFGIALAWMADAVRHLKLGKESRPPNRPWAWAFDAGEKRQPEERHPGELLSDWVADEIWSLKFTEDSNFEMAKLELATRLAIADYIIKRLVEHEGCRADRAAAEAIMIVELIGESDFWEEVRDAMVLS